MILLSRIEEMLLLAIWKLKDNAYGITIRQQVERDTGIKWMSGAIYAPLSRLRKNGLVSVFKGTVSTPQGGRPRIYYKLTPPGMDKLISIQAVNQRLWLGVPDLNKESKI